jgi:uncharacterized membrane protein
VLLLAAGLGLVGMVGLVVAVVGFLGLRQRLPLNRFFGVRTSATLRSADTFRVANRVAGLPTLVAGLAGVAAAMLGGVLASPLIAVVGLVGMVAIAVSGGALGHRVAVAMPEPKPEPPAGCGGCACGNCLRSVGANVAGVGGE